jgi:hypothetical protein
MGPGTLRRIVVGTGLAIAAVLLGIGLNANRLHDNATGEAGWTAYRPGHLPPEVRHPGPIGYYAGRWWIVAGVIVGLLVLVAFLRRPESVAKEPAAPTSGRRQPWRIPRPPMRAVPALAVAVGFLAVGLFADRRQREPLRVCAELRGSGKLDGAPEGIRQLCPSEPLAVIAHDAGRWWIATGVALLLILLVALSPRRTAISASRRGDSNP